MKFLSLLIFCTSLSCATRFGGGQCKAPSEYAKMPVATIMKEAKEIVSRPGEKRAIAFCVYGSKKIYTHGVLENIEIAKDLYPGWDVVIFFDSETVPKEIIDEARTRGARVEVGPFNSAAARFFVIDMDYDRIISRDADSRIYPREVAAVADWMKNDWAILHNMRDAKNQTNPMLAGMFGARVKQLREKLKEAGLNSNVKSLYKEFIGDKKAVYGDDEKFLREKLLTAVGLDHFLTHESFQCDAFPHSRGFPIPRGNAGIHIGGVRNWD